MLSYATDVELENHVDAILMAAVSRDKARAEMQAEDAELPEGQSVAVSRYAEVWPRVESSEDIRSDSKGRVRTRRRWYLVLSNIGDAPARDVQVDIQAMGDSGEPWFVHRDTKDDEPAAELLAPRGDIRFPILASLGSAAQGWCVVTWTDDRGVQENTATLRLS